MATNKHTLTERAVRALKPKTSVYRVRDGIADPDLKGFGVVVAPSGAKSFFISFTSPESGQRTQGALGRFPGTSLAAARETARQWRAQIREGIDPVQGARRREEAAQAAREAEASLGTVAQLFDLYCRDLEADGKRSAQFVRGIFRREISPAMGAKRARDVTVDAAADLIADIAGRGHLVLANRTRGYGLSAFNFGMKVRNLPRWRKEAPNFDIDSNPFARTEKALKREPRGQRHLSRDELRWVWIALGASYQAKQGNGATRDVALDTATQIALKLLLATGQRVEEVLHATWDEFDREAKVWAIPAERRKNASKNASGEPHLVPLTDLHLRLLDTLEPFSEGSRFLFPARDGDKPRDYRSLTQAVSRLCARTGITRFSPRDIRRTWKTLAGSIGIDLEIRNRIQGHAFDDIGSRAYDRYSYLDEKRRAMERWTAFVDTLVAEQDNVPFAKEARR